MYKDEYVFVHCRKKHVFRRIMAYNLCVNLRQGIDVSFMVMLTYQRLILSGLNVLLRNQFVYFYRNLDSESQGMFVSKITMVFA